MSAPPSLRYRGIVKDFPRRRLLGGVSLAADGGRAILLYGENGSGKTTLLRILAGLEPPTAGSVDFGHGELPWRACRRTLQRHVMYLHQHPYMFDGSVAGNLQLAVPRALPKAQRTERVRDALDWAQLGPLAAAHAKTLSGGEKQRVSLARAWLRGARYLLLDEPITHLDAAAQERTMALLERLKAAHTALVISSHHPAAFAALVDEQMHLAGGQLTAPPVRRA